MSKGEVEMIKFNINHYVYVKLTDEGRTEVRHQHEQLYSMLPDNLKDTTFTPEKEDDQGWSRWQFWSLMNTFGLMMRMGQHLPFETEIRIETS
jgi:ketosteroid isomerase-like protein